MDSITLPMILSGPIVRRAEPDQLTIWIATSKSYQIHAKVFRTTSGKDSNSFDYHIIQTKCETKMIRMGKQLFIHLIQLSPYRDTFPTDTLLGYNIYFKRGSELQDLSSIGLLSKDNPHSITYGSLNYPSIFLNSSANSCNVLYGSCRKPHGEDEDTLSIADILLEKEYNNFLVRPSSLFLMGDQIYADDVSDPLFPVISKLSEELIGAREPLELLDGQLKSEPFCTALNQVNGRQYIMENFCQLTSSHTSNHLMKFGEYAAMYLLSWSPQLWETAEEYALFEQYDECLKKNQIYFVFPKEEKYAKEHKNEEFRLNNRYTEQQEALISFQHSLYRIRRLLANTPTYMMFDDHDITDDWNVSSRWKENVKSSALGSHVVANGLSAYWAFQGWGNAPQSYDDKFLWMMKTYFKMLSIGKINTYQEVWKNTLWDFDSWHFVAPTNPQALFLDTRTQREYRIEPRPAKFGQLIEESVWAPQLISQKGWERITRSLYASKWKSGSPLIIVSATPLYGLGLIETFLHDYVYPLKVLGVNVHTKFDFEAWKYNGKGFTEFLQQVAAWNPARCIILSGDVHYASAVTAAVSFKNGQELTINQFTSSPLKNMSFRGLWGTLMKQIMALNSLKRKNNQIYRVCTPSYYIKEVNEGNISNSYLWMDIVNYKTLENNSIMETNNNLGFLMVRRTTIKNFLLNHHHIFIQP
ncbi:hypothetical protein [Neobacillus sp. DY30]|uniref:alkaline phosphatase D family protein n=1 Tax=Neobacillus sp. DY30 TaxID=3047871 RepID=UPI0024BFAE6A|nr:hypothetical protein [Neobacillus sp. DY30]WHY03005.1 hypothetical protein QNH29_12620 [Neobacillus sp. DY30]